jgi:molybdopterin converting factor small subunit
METLQNIKKVYENITKSINKKWSVNRKYEIEIKLEEQEYLNTKKKLVQTYRAQYSGIVKKVLLRFRINTALNEVIIRNRTQLKSLIEDIKQEIVKREHKESDSKNEDSEDSDSEEEWRWNLTWA